MAAAGLVTQHSDAYSMDADGTGLADGLAQTAVFGAVTVAKVVGTDRVRTAEVTIFRGPTRLLMGVWADLGTESATVTLVEPSSDTAVAILRDMVRSETGATLPGPTCASCGTVNLRGARYCTNCGAALDDGEPQTPATQSGEALRQEPPTPSLPPSDTADRRLVPTGGMSAWAAPDPNGSVIAQLAQGTDLRVKSRRGAWAEVEASSGWTGWVDDRLLIEPEPAVDAAATQIVPPPPPPGEDAVAAGLDESTTAPRLRVLGVLSILGGLAAVIGVFLPWLSGGLDTNGLDVPVQFLWDHETGADNDVAVGVITLVIGAVAAGLTLMPWLPKTRSVLVPLLGLAVVAIGAAYLVQVARLADLLGLDFADLVGVGPFVVGVGGVLVIIGGGRLLPPRR